jgi:hypothetical protein
MVDRVSSRGMLYYFIYAFLPWLRLLLLRNAQFSGTGGRSSSRLLVGAGISRSCSAVSYLLLAVAGHVGVLVVVAGHRGRTRSFRFHSSVGMLNGGFGNGFHTVVWMLHGAFGNGFHTAVFMVDCTSTGGQG